MALDAGGCPDRRIRVHETGQCTSVVRLYRLQMARADQTASDKQDTFHITAPICQGTNS
jgi:hypothetical protein